MKRLVGGEYLLDLSSIELEQSVDGETYTNITNKDILEQLTNLKKFIPNPNMIKPAWVKLYNGETDELVVVHGQVSNVDDGEFDIDVSISGYTLKIHVEFTQAVNSNSQPIDDWYIDTNDAKYLFTSNAQNIGAISSLPVFENIVDKDGHKRFIEGDMIPAETLPEGFEIEYAKWSLSGTHLLMVVAGNIADGTVVTGLNFAITKDLPQWVMDKIYPVVGVIIEYKSMNAYNENYSATALNIGVAKIASGIRFSIAQTATISDDRTFRIQADLLIDNEEESE